jgi:ankyrin repeat protein
MEPSVFLEFVRLIIDDDVKEVARRLRTSPELATMSLPVGSSKAKSYDTFFAEISHYIYGGDTALHMAAAALNCPVAKLLISHAANSRAKNRRGAEPLHYAADGASSNTQSQAEVIKYLVAVGADPNAVDKSRVTPLHRAVRRRSHAAVLGLLDAGANLRQPNQSGSTPLHLAVQTTGASGSGSAEAREQQELIIRLLLERGAKLTDRDLKGKTVLQAANSIWIREILTEFSAG